MFTSCLRRCFSGEKIPETEIEKISYSLGVNTATNLKQSGFKEINTNTFTKAFNDVFNENDLDISFSDSKIFIKEYLTKGWSI